MAEWEEECRPNTRFQLFFLVWSPSPSQSPFEFVDLTSLSPAHCYVDRPLVSTCPLALPTNACPLPQTSQGCGGVGGAQRWALGAGGLPNIGGFSCAYS